METQSRTMSTIELREITNETLRPILKLDVRPDQQTYVAPNAVSISEAYFNREEAWFRGIYADGEPVGFVMLSLKPETGEYWVWRYMIDAKHQGKGYGKAAMTHVIDFVRTQPKAKKLFLSHVKGNEPTAAFYKSIGFRHTGEEEDGELVMVINL
jgi:diamine N-acetyltransferase